MILSGHYNWWLVALSYVVATLASYLSLQFASSGDADETRHAWADGVVPASLALGTGIWTMHFIGMPPTKSMG